MSHRFGRWIMEVWVVTVEPEGEWRAVSPSGSGEPYRYGTEDKARRMLEICYPDQCRDARLGDEPIVRVRQTEPQAGDTRCAECQDGCRLCDPYREARVMVEGGAE